MKNTGHCPICKTDAEFVNNSGGVSRIACPRCGTFSIGWQASPPSEFFDARQIANLSGWIRENQGFVLTPQNLKGLAALRAPTVGEKAEKLLTFLATEFPKPGEIIATNIIFSSEGLELSAGDQPKAFVEALRLVSVSWSLDSSELEFLVYKYLISEKQFLDPVSGENLQITPKGWSQIDSLRYGNPQSKTGFIAMWFDASVNEAWNAIDQGIRAAGYDALRADQQQHNNEITDEIISGIRRSKFLVADLTGHRNGVYFEAGFAKGLGLDVVWLCRRDELEKAHFDTRQNNFIVWDADKLPELTKALQNRIEATISRGPRQPTSVT